MEEHSAKEREPKEGPDILLTSKVSPDLFEWVMSRPEGPRTYLERLIAEDRAKVKGDVESAVYSEAVAEA